MDILIVEDDELTHRALMMLVGKMGLTPRGAKNSTEAFEAVDSQPPQLLLTDWDLGEDRSGIDVANYAIESNQRCHIIFSTGNPIDMLKCKTGHLTGCRYIQKPWSLRQFEDTLSEVLAEE